MKKIISNFLKGVGAITLTAGLVLAADLGISRLSGESLTKNIWDKVVFQLETNTESISTQNITITNLLNEIETLKTKVSNLESSSGGENILGKGTTYYRDTEAAKWCSVIEGTGGICSGSPYESYSCNSGTTQILLSSGTSGSRLYKTYMCLKN